MLKKYSLLFLLFSPCVLLLSQSGFTTIGGANFIGFARAGVNVAGIESMYMNQAGLTGIKNIGIDVSIERRFNLEELTNISIAAAKSFKFGTFGILLSNFGFSEYSEQKFGLAYARKLNNKISLGGQLDLLRLNISQFGSKNLVTFEIGMQLKLNKEFEVATHIFSPGNINLSEGNDLGTRFRLGLKYNPSEKVFVLVELDKLIYRQIEYKVGLAYQAIKDLQIRLGVNPTTQTFSFGALLFFKNTYKLGTAYALNGNLGNTTSLTLQHQN